MTQLAPNLFPHFHKCHGYVSSPQPPMAPFLFRLLSLTTPTDVSFWKDTPCTSSTFWSFSSKNTNTQYLLNFCVVCTSFREQIMKSFFVDREGLTVLKAVLPSWGRKNENFCNFHPLERTNSLELTSVSKHHLQHLFWPFYAIQTNWCPTFFRLNELSVEYNLEVGKV